MNRVNVIELAPSTVLTHGGNQVRRNVEVLVNGVKLYGWMESSSGCNYASGERFDEYIQRHVETLEAALGCKAVDGPPVVDLGVEGAERQLLGLSDRELKMIAGEATHQHYKGGLYRYVAGGMGGNVPTKICNADTGGPLSSFAGNEAVLYQHMAPHEQDYWVREEAEWVGGVPCPEWHPAYNLNGHQIIIHRFRPLGSGWAHKGSN